eukprot:TRINITY_DN18374_c0_g1_i1.p1 TRINITY_DN18374_c0_g1~~TRINITY_DN18374_c0_g1_i1.p1  ORF type:complete len:808 (+),score=176.48 TRINITY_DN18374_c0_g1_i1:194-2425(+)
MRTDLEKHSRSIEDLVVVHCRHLEEHLRVAHEQQDELKDENLRMVSNFETKLESFHTKQAEHQAAFLQSIEEKMQDMLTRRAGVLQSIEENIQYMPTQPAATPPAFAQISPEADDFSTAAAIVGPSPSLEEALVPGGFGMPGQVPEDEDNEYWMTNNSHSPGSSALPSPRDASQEEPGDGGGEGGTPSSKNARKTIAPALAKVGAILGARTTAVAKTTIVNDANLSFAEMKEAYGVARTKTRDSKMLLEAMSKSGVFRRVCTQVVIHPRFEPLCSVIMILCGIQIGVEAHVGMDAANKGEKVEFREIDLVFNSFFTIELIIRWAADGCFFWSCNNSALRWNLMDICLVSVGWVQELLTLLASSGGFIDLGMMRLLRMLRLVRIARILRVVRFFSELRVMVNGILGSAKSLLWAFILLCLVMFTIGVTIMQIATVFVEGNRDDALQAQTIADLKEYYGSLLRTILTLYMAIAGGIDWRDSVVPLREIHIVMELLVSGYVFFTTFCCLNIVTGIFVDNAKALKMADEEAMFQEALAERRRWISEVADLFSKVGNTSKGCESFDFETFKMKMHDIRVQTIFRKLGINVDTTSAEELWEILDTDNSGNIDQEEFANGIKHFHGDAKSIDVYRLRRDGKKFSKQIDELQSAVQKMMLQMASAFGAPAASALGRRPFVADMKAVASGGKQAELSPEDRADALARQRTLLRQAAKAGAICYGPGPPAPEIACDPPGSAPEMKMPSKESLG